MFEGKLVSICLASEGSLEMRVVDQAEAQAGKGLVEDRYANGRGSFQRGDVEADQQITLIEQEAIQGACAEYDLQFTHPDTRRNLLTEGIPLNHLVGRTFRVGTATLRGVRLCEPCQHLEKLTCQGIARALIHRGGLRAEVVSGGTLIAGDRIGPAES